MGKPKLPPAQKEDTTEEFVVMTDEQIASLTTEKQVAYYKSLASQKTAENEVLKSRKGKAAKTAFLKEALGTVGFSFKQPGSLGHLMTAFNPDSCEKSRSNYDVVADAKEAIRDQLFDAEGNQLSSVDGDRLWDSMAEYHHAIKQLPTARDDGYEGLPWATNAVVCIGGASELTSRKRVIDGG